MKTNDRIQKNKRSTYYIALSGMALTLCLLSLLLFRGPLSIIQALVIPIVFVIMTIHQPWKFTFAAGVSLLMLTLAFFLTQIIFMLLYLIMAFFLLSLVSIILKGTRKHYLLFTPYLIVNGILLFLGLRMTDLVFQTQLHTMMLRLSSDNALSYTAIIMLESAFISTLHLLIISHVSRRKARITQ